MKTKDKLVIGGHEFDSRFILGSGKYSMKLIEAAVRDAGAQIITLAVRRANTKDHENILDYIPEGVTLLPNTSGARNAQEAVRIARLARELGCDNIRVNAVAPGITRTDMVAALPEAVIKPLIATIPLGRVGEPEDIANAFVFLASDEASYITGVVLSVDGMARA